MVWASKLLRIWMLRVNLVSCETEGICPSKSGTLQPVPILTPDSDNIMKNEMGLHFMKYQWY